MENIESSPGQNKFNEDDKPSILSIMIDKHEAIEKTVSLIKKELTQEAIPGLTPVQKQQSTGASAETLEPKSEDEFKGLTTLLEDSKVQSAIKVVAGKDTQEIIDKALLALRSSESVGDKSKVLSDGIKKLHANLRQSDKSKLQSDPLFSLAIGLVGMRQNGRN